MTYICIPVHNRIEVTASCLQSIERQDLKDICVVVCDDGSTDGTSEYLAKHHADVSVLQGNGNLWWAGATNECVKYALGKARSGDFVFTLNNDTELLPDTLVQLVRDTHSHPRSIIGGVNVFIDDPTRIEPSAYRRTNRPPLYHLHKSVNNWGDPLREELGLQEVDSLSAKGVLIPIEAFKDAGLYNAKDLPQYHSDTEFVFRAKRHGFNVYIDYRAKILSHQHFSGLGTVTSEPVISEFIQSFSSIRSANHYGSLRNYCMLLYGRSYRLYLAANLLKIILGFCRRYVFRKG